ncbi:MAG: HD domain-containing protein [Agathobacter sp.]|nr:HD domain-containing protein [Agathobacter sp.]
MAVEMFASIYIGSYEVSLKIFEISQKKGMREVEHIRSRIDLGKDTFENGSISYGSVEKLCDTLSEFSGIIKTYRVEHYEVYAGAVLREAENEIFVLDQIGLRTGFDVKVISNSEHRFLSYRSLAGREKFEKMIQGSAAMLDVGGAGIQITLFQAGKLITTRHIEVGSMRLRSLLEEGISYSREHYLEQLEEFISKRLEEFKIFFLGGNVDSLILMSDYCQELVKYINKDEGKQHLVKTERFMKFIDKLLKKPVEVISKDLNLSNEKDPLIIPSLLIFKELAEIMESKEVWVPETNVNDGIASAYVQDKRLLKISHDFDADIISAAKNLSRHFNSYSKHVEALVIISDKIFDAMKKVHGLTRRHRLLLEVACLLHDCGKYISLSNAPTCAYNIIMSSEILGLSHLEREMIALTVLYNTLPLENYEELSDQLDKESYLVVAKLSAILRVANALDQSHKQKFKNIRVSTKERELVITVEAFENIALEQTLFENKTSYFENVFSMKPVLREKRIYEL